MTPKTKKQALLFLISSLLMVVIFAAVPVQADDCDPLTIACASEILDVPFEVHDADPHQPVLMVARILVRMVISEVPEYCYEEWVAIVSISDVNALQQRLQFLGNHPSNAMGVLSYDDYVDLVAILGVMTILDEGPATRHCIDVSDPQDPPCELPWEPIEIDIIKPPDGDIILMSSIRPVTNPEFCFSIELGRTPFDFAPDIQIPFFFASPGDMKGLKQLIP